MGEVGKAGRTILFVSHNMAAVQSLCKTAFQLESGRIVQTGDSRSVVSEYLSGSGKMTSAMIWSDESAPGNEYIRLKSIRAHADDQNVAGVYQSKNDIYIEMIFTANRAHSSLCVGFDLLNAHGETILRSYQTDMVPGECPNVKQGKNIWRCVIPGGLLNGGVFSICPRIGLHNLNWIVHLDSVLQFEVILNHGVSPFWSSLDGRNRPGNVAPILRWENRN
jgi:lipopolysaccharide transport system ATP-binding protein